MAVNDPGEMECTFHPGVKTRLRCSRCGRPICPRCMVATPVGYRCPDCARGPVPLAYQTSMNQLVGAISVGAGVAVLIAVLWGRFPAWEFYWCVALGFGISEAIAWMAKGKRGPQLMTIAMVAVVVGLIGARVAMVYFSDFLSYDMLFNHGLNAGVRNAFQLSLIPDFVFMTIPFIVNYIRFR